MCRHEHLRPLVDDRGLDVAVHAQPYAVLPLIKGSCPPPAQAMKGDCLEIVDLDVYDDPSPPPPVPPEKSSEVTLDHLSESLEALFNAHLLETPELNRIKEFLATPEQEGQGQVEEALSAENCQSRSSTAVEQATLSLDLKESEVTEASEDFVENNKDMETPACPNGE
ncbi:hypothetical protein MHYP_G00207710 [Metynnis hypsauchen]